jgi:hypothetical protein
MSKVFIDNLESSYRSGKLPKLVSESLCLVSVTKALGYSSHGRYTKMLRDFCISSGIDISHFTLNGMPPTEILEKQCPQCNILFTCKKSEEKETCSHACANIYFAHKQGAKNRKDGSTTYVDALNRFYTGNNLKIKCCVCEESRVLDVHHVDEDRANNEVSNLVFLCPNHHAVYHRFGDQGIIEAIVTELDIRVYSTTG